MRHCGIMTSKLWKWLNNDGLYTLNNKEAEHIKQPLLDMQEQAEESTIVRDFNVLFFSRIK